MSDRHPLLAECPKEFWHRLEDVHAAQACVGDAVSELVRAMSSAIDPDGSVPAAYWQFCLSPHLWSLLSYIFDRAAIGSSVLTKKSLPEVPEAGFSARECILLLHDNPAVQAWVDQAVDMALAGASIEDLAAAMRPVSIERPGRGKKTPQMTHGWVGKLRRSVMFWEGHAEIVHFGAPFTHAEARRMARESRGRIRRLPFPEHCARLVWKVERRRQLIEQCRNKLSSRLAQAALPSACALAPTACIEQLDEVWDWVGPHPLPKVIATVLGAERSPYFAALAARVKADGGTMVGMQHGGYYGATDPTWYEKLEYEVCDAYATWGYQQRPKHHPLPAVRLSQLKPCAPASDPPGPGKPLKLFWAHDTNVGGAASLAAVPQFRRQVEYEADLARGFGAVASRLQAKVTLRPYPRLASDSALDDWKENIPSLSIEPGAGRSLIEQAQEHHVSLFGFPGATGFIEHIHAGWPAIIFCPPDYCPVRPEAEPVFDALKSACIFVENEAELEASLRAFHAEGRQWWESPERQTAREKFRQAFCLTSDDPCHDWVQALLTWVD